MEKLGKLQGPRGGELMKAVLTKHNDGKRRTEGGGRDDRSKRPREVMNGNSLFGVFLWQLSCSVVVVRWWRDGGGGARVGEKGGTTLQVIIVMGFCCV